MRKYVCDNCGKEFTGKLYYDEEAQDYRFTLWSLAFSPIDNERNSQRYWNVKGEYCKNCMEKIEKRIKEGVN